MEDNNSIKDDNVKEKHWHGRIFIGFIALCLIMVCTAFFSYRAFRHRKYIDACNRANILDLQGNYETALKQYELAIKYSNTDSTDIVIRMADIYVKLDEYNSAAKILQTYYGKTKDNRIKLKKNAIIDAIIEKDYANRIERGNHYNLSREYDKAIQEYLAAYRLEPYNKEVLQLTIQAYLNNHEIKKAKEIFEQTKSQLSEKLSISIQENIENAEIKEEYDHLIVEAEDFFYNESYEDCFTTYEEAIELLPEEMEAYEKIVDAYVSLQRYDDAIKLIMRCVEQYHYTGLNVLLTQTQAKKTTEEAYGQLLKKVYLNLKKADTEKLLYIIHSNNYKHYITEGTTYYYDASNQRLTSQIPKKKGMIIYSSGYIYEGDFKNGKRDGVGSLFSISNDTLGYILYNGKWKEDLPEGKGVLKTSMEFNYHDEKTQFNVIVQGNYSNGVEDGKMRRDFYLKNEYIGYLEYTCSYGIPQPIDINSSVYTFTSSYDYDIGTFMGIDETFAFTYSHGLGIWEVPGI